jgi:hypothetical protein
VIPVGGIRLADHAGVEPIAPDRLDIAVDLHLERSTVNPHGVCDGVTSEQTLDADDAI